MKTTGIWDGTFDAEGTPNLTAPTAADARAMMNAAGQPRSLDAATCSLPVSSAEALIRDWETCVRSYERWRLDADHKGQLDWKARYQNVIDAYNHCIAGLRRQVEAASVRQPEENIQDVPRPARQNEKEST